MRNKQVNIDYFVPSIIYIIEKQEVIFNDQPILTKDPFGLAFEYGTFLQKSVLRYDNIYNDPENRYRLAISANSDYSEVG